MAWRRVRTTSSQNLLYHTLGQIGIPLFPPLTDSLFSYPIQPYCSLSPIQTPKAYYQNSYTAHNGATGTESFSNQGSMHLAGWIIIDDDEDEMSSILREVREGGPGGIALVLIAWNLLGT